MIGINVRGSVDSTVPVERSMPLYAVLGDTIFLLAALIFAVILVFAGRNRDADSYV
jgi:apolipoprotein N-acyltransferase